MQIDKTIVSGNTAGEVSRRNAVDAVRTNSSTQESADTQAADTDTFELTSLDLVQIVLRSQDKAAENRVAQLRHAYQSGDYTARTHEVARTILAGILCGY